MNTTSVPTEAITIYNNALELSNKGDLDTALDEYRRAIKVHPNFIEAYNNIGEIYSKLGDKNQAINSYEVALNIKKNYRVLLNLGVEYYNNFNYDKALNYFLESLSIQPNFIEGNYYTGMIYYNNKEFKTAKDYFLEVLKEDKKHVKANFLLSYIYYEWKDYHKTIKHLDTIKDLTENKTFLNRYYGFCYYFLGDHKKAVQHLTTALESHPKYSKFVDYLENISYENRLKEIGDVDQSIRELEEKHKNGLLGISDATKLSMLYIFKNENDKAENLLIGLKKAMNL